MTHVIEKNVLTLNKMVNKTLKNYLFLAALHLCCCAQAFSSCRERGLLSSRNAEACNCDHFLVDEHRL